MTIQGGNISGIDAALTCFANATGELPALVMRNVAVTVSAGQPGIQLQGPGSYDLGTSYSPGGNTFDVTTGTAVSAAYPGVTLTASGNTWMEGVQGASASGQMVVGTSLTGPLSCPTTGGCNFNLGGATDSITF